MLERIRAEQLACAAEVLNGNPDQRGAWQGCTDWFLEELLYLKEARANMIIELWPIDKPIPYARNARTISATAVDKVAASIKEFGWRQPIVVEETLLAVSWRCLGWCEARLPCPDSLNLEREHLQPIIDMIVRNDYR